MLIRCTICGDQLDELDQDESHKVCSSCRARCKDCGHLLSRHATWCEQLHRLSSRPQTLEL